MIVMTVGRLTSQKNPKRFLEIAALAKKENLDMKFIWIGGGAIKEEMEYLKNKLDLSDYVLFFDYVKNPYPYLKMADVLMVTSDYEGFCLAICEAMTLGIPVVSTRTAGPTEIIGDNEYGILCPHSPEDLFIELKKLYFDSSYKLSIGSKGKSRPDDFSEKSTLNLIYSLI